MNFRHIPIINYHKIEPQLDIGITSRHPEMFARDMGYLARNKFNVITFQDLAGSDPLPENSIIITFDDGYASVYEIARPIMQEFGFTAVVFIPGFYIGKQNDWDIQFGNKRYPHMNAVQIAEMSAAGFEIASHGMYHLPFTQMNASQLAAELSQSKELLEDMSGREVISICYPFGLFNSRVIDAVRKSGYQYGVASLYRHRLQSGLAQWCWPRFNIYRFDSIASLAKKTKNNINSPIAYRDWLIQMGGRLTPLYQKIKDGKKHEF